MKVDKQFNMRVTEEELRKLKLLAQAAGKTRAQLLRGWIDAAELPQRATRCGTP